MRIKNCSIAAMLLTICLVLSGCIAVDDPNTDKTGGTTTMPNESIHVYQNAQYTYSTAVDEAILTTALSPAYLILANKQSPLSQDHAPESLVYVKDVYVTEWHKGNMHLDARAAAAVEAMIAEMHADGVSDILVTSGYRSYARQKALFDGYVEKEMGMISAEAYIALGGDYIQRVYTNYGLQALSRADAERVVKTYSAIPGTSEHQTGLCVDFITDSMNGDLTVAFENTEAFRWLAQNAYKFGFILRYPKDLDSVTGYSYEPWHYRFVGREAATDIYFSGLTLEQYLACLG